jgi:hypothetical protein
VYLPAKAQSLSNIEVRSCTVQVSICSQLRWVLTSLMTMSLLPTSELFIRQKKRRIANNNYSKLFKTLVNKFTKLCHDYDAKIYFLACRNGRYHGFVSTDDKGQPWSPPSQDALVSFPSLLSVQFACKPETGQAPSCMCEDKSPFHEGYAAMAGCESSCKLCRQDGLKDDSSSDEVVGGGPGPA